MSRERLSADGKKDPDQEEFDFSEPEEESKPDTNSKSEERPYIHPSIEEGTEHLPWWNRR